MGRKTAALVKALAAQPDKTSDIPGIHTAENWWDTVVFFLYVDTLQHTPEMRPKYFIFAVSGVEVGAHLQQPKYSAMQMKRNTQFPKVKRRN